MHNKCVGYYVDECLQKGIDPILLPSENKEKSEPEMLLDYISNILGYSNPICLPFLLLLECVSHRLHIPICSSSTHPIGKNIAAFIHQFELQYRVESPDVRTLSFETSQQRLTEETLHKAANEVRAYVRILFTFPLSPFYL